MKFLQEKLYLVSDSFIWVFQQHANINYFTFQFQHVIQDQMCDHHETLLTHMNISIVKKIEHILGSLVHLIRKSVE